jgi:hypothetical protein
MKTYILYRENISHTIYCRYSLSYLQARFREAGIYVTEIINLFYK